MQYPVIGIRPTIDGRRKGVRESLEEQTMGMAKAAKALIEKNVFYPCLFNGLGRFTMLKFLLL